MARPRKLGLEYFPFDTALYDDIKIRKLIKYHGGGAVSVYTFLLCTIYKNGYYIKWDKDLPFIISEGTGFEENFINSVVQCCLDTGLFSQEQLTKNNIITGKGVQSRYELVCKISKRSIVIKSEFTCIDSEETVVNTEITGVITEETLINSESSTQSKVKERKGNKREVKKGMDILSDDDYPSIETIKSYVVEAFHSSQVTALNFANQFHNYYSEKSWTVKGGGKMKNWKMAISKTWKSTLEELISKYPKEKEVEENSLPVEAKKERELRKINYDQRTQGAPHFGGPNFIFPAPISIFHVGTGRYDELRK